MKVYKAFGRSQDTLIYGTDTRLADSDSFIGLELELEGVQVHDWLEDLNSFFWDIKTDGSLRDGCELVFDKPMKGANIIKALSILDKAVEKIKDVYNRTPKISGRTSMHVHLDVRDLETTQVNNLIRTYMLFEKVLFEYVGIYRIKNNYCRPIVCSTFTDVLKRLNIYDGNLDNYISVITNECDKYSALNVKAIAVFGSLEFRHHPGSYKSEEILPWINLILSLKSWIKRGNTVESLLELDPRDAIIEVFGEYGTVLLSLNYASPFYDNKSRVIEALHIRELSLNTNKILMKKSVAKNKLINMYQTEVIA